MTSPGCCFPAELGPFHPICPKTARCQFDLCYFETLPCLTLLRIVHFIVIADQKMRNSEYFFFLYFECFFSLMWPNLFGQRIDSFYLI